MNAKKTAPVLKFKNTTVWSALFLFLMCLSPKLIAQKIVKDSVWLTIDTFKEQSFFKKPIGYKIMFQTPMQFPLLLQLPKNYQIEILKNSTSNLLQQFNLEDAYTEKSIQGTSLKNSLNNASYLSFPFANIITSLLAEQLQLTTNSPKIVAFKETIQQLNSVNTTFSTSQMLVMANNNYEITINKSLYLRKRLLDFLIGNYNQNPESYKWIRHNNELIPYVSFYKNQYMKYDDDNYHLLNKLIPAYKHFEPYGKTIKNIKKISKLQIGFDVNLLSEIPYETWRKEIRFIKDKLSEKTLHKIKIELPKGSDLSIINQLFEILIFRIKNLDVIANAYYNLIHKNKIIYSTNANDVIKITRKQKSTVIQIYASKTGENKPKQEFEFFNNTTHHIWLYALNGNDYFTATGTSKSYIPIALIGGKGNDKYVLDNGTKITIYDEKKKTYLIKTHKAKVKLATTNKFTTVNNTKYKHVKHKLKPKFGANPDDGLFIGFTHEILTQNFNRNPFSQKHKITAIANLGNLGINANYYAEVATLSNYFNAFVNLGYQSPNYATNFFGLGNETPNLDRNLKLNYNRVRIESFYTQIGLVKNEKKYKAIVNLFVESYKTEATQGRFITSETLFTPTKGFFNRKNYTGLHLKYQYKNASSPLYSNLKFNADFSAKGIVNTTKTNNRILILNPTFQLSHPIYGDKISIATTFNYTTAIGNVIPFYYAANLGGNSGLRGFRNQRFTGNSAAHTNINIIWKAKDLKSEVLPLQIGFLAGFDAGRVWKTNEFSNLYHTSIGGGIWLQTANLLKAQLQVFGFNEGARLSFKLSIGI